MAVEGIQGRLKLLLVKIIAIVFLCEFVVMLLLAQMELSLTVIGEALLDATLLSITISPLIYFLVIKPYVKNRLSANQRLREHEFALNQHTIFAETDLHGTIVDVNDLFVEISEYSREELIGKTHNLVSSGKHDGAFWQEVFSKLHKGEIWRGDICNRSKSGKEYWLRTSLIPILNEEGKPDRYLALRTDITETIEKGEELKVAVQELEKISAEQDRMLSVVAHELRTPASSISMLLEHPEEYEPEEWLNLLRGNTAHLLGVMEELKAVRNPDTEILRQIQEVELAPLLEQIVDSLRQGFNTANEISVSIPTELTQPIRANPQSIRQAVSNLIRNAILHAESNQIWVTAQPVQREGESPLVEIIVCDDGRGVREADREAIFDDFFRGDTKASGTGLGLGVSRRLARAQGGDLIYQEREGGGACFVYTFVTHPQEENSAGEPQSDETASIDDLSGQSLLIIEDDLTLQMLTRKVVEKLGARVTVASDGVQGVVAAREQPFDLILSDIMMPNMNGYEAVKTLRAEGYDGTIIGVSAATIGDEFDQMLDAGADAMISKPITPKALLNALAKVHSA